MTTAIPPDPTTPAGQHEGFAPCDPSIQPFDYMIQMTDAHREACANLAEAFVYTATALLAPVWGAARVVRFSRDAKPDSPLIFEEVADARAATIATRRDLAQVADVETAHAVQVAISNLKTAYARWQEGGGARALEREWSISVSRSSVIFYLPATRRDERPEPPRGLIRRVWVGSAEARTYDAGSHHTADGRFVGHYRQTLTAYGATVSLEHSEAEPGVRIAIGADPDRATLAINGTAASMRPQERRLFTSPPQDGESETARIARLNREAIAENNDDAGAFVEYPGVRVFICLTPEGLAVNYFTGEFAADESLTTPDDLPGDLPLLVYREDELRCRDIPGRPRAIEA